MRFLIINNGPKYRTWNSSLLEQAIERIKRATTDGKEQSSSISDVLITAQIIVPRSNLLILKSADDS